MIVAISEQFFKLNFSLTPWFSPFQVFQVNHSSLAFLLFVLLDYGVLVFDSAYIYSDFS